ncbi:MAG TPA: DinB family protein [Phycisphaerae bacterium]|nr:DinB family protein [Phycisphaerae bacterium]
MNDENLHSIVIAGAIEKLRDHMAQIERCVGLLNDEQLWFRPNQSSNSVANLLLHLRGNMGQWMLGGLGGRPFERHRQAEFDARDAGTGKQPLAPLQNMVETVCELLQILPDGGLVQRYLIQGYTVTGASALMHVVEHFAFHTGQIVTTTKWLRDVDVSLYDKDGHRRDGRLSGTP